ncbi:acyl-CoA N-acyltransferase [Atractiella rhizophila]|nr:acyl-CoA N-acyltransferase [Atractiella rhizophila]
MSTVPVVKFHSERLAYRTSEKSDIPIFVKIFDEHALLASHLETRPMTTERWEQYFANHEKSPYFITICLVSDEEGEGKGKKKAGQVIGQMSLSAAETRFPVSRFAIKLGSEYQGKGYGKEALLWLLEQGFEHYGLHKVSGDVLSWNEPAKKLYKSIGFKTEGIQRECFYLGGKFYDNHCLGILEREWRQRYRLEKSD